MHILKKKKEVFFQNKDNLDKIQDFVSNLNNTKVRRL